MQPPRTAINLDCTRKPLTFTSLPCCYSGIAALGRQEDTASFKLGTPEYEEHQRKVRRLLYNSGSRMLRMAT